MNERYKYQLGLPGWGEKGQEALARKKVAIVGLGGLGSHSAIMLARSGVQRFGLADPDTVAISNLHRQSFTEDDVDRGRSKVHAIHEQISYINKWATCERWFNLVEVEHMPPFMDGVDLIIDGLDNWPARYALNDYCVEHGIPFIYGAVSGVMGMVYPILPKTKNGDTPWEKKGIWTRNLREAFGEPPDERSPSSKTPISLGPLLPIIANLQVIEALKILIGNYEAVNKNLVSFNAWEGKWREIDVNR